MYHISGSNSRNESTIDIVFDLVEKYQSEDNFYSSVINFLFEGYGSQVTIDEYISQSKKENISLVDLVSRTRNCLNITPLKGFEFSSKGVEKAYQFRNDWNNNEFIWSTSDRYYFFSWGTSA